MADTLIERVLDRSVEQSLRLDWSVHRGLTPPVDELERGAEYILILRVVNERDLMFERLEVRLTPSNSDAFGDHLQFYDAHTYARPCPSVVFRFDELRPRQSTPAQTAFFKSRINLRGRQGITGLFESTIHARIVPTGTDHRVQRW